MSFRSIVRKIIFGYKADSDTYICALRKKGAKIGRGVHIYASPRDCVIDEQNPYLLSIGDNVQITHGVVILTHDYSWSVLKGKYGEVLGHQEPVSIGNNVFIGMNAVILAGSIIGNNVIVGAGSIVSGYVPSDVVVAGNPARVLCTMSEYRDKRKGRQLSEAVSLYCRYRARYGYEPNKELFREYFWLFENESANLIGEFREVNSLVSSDITSSAFESWSSQFNTYQDFLGYCRLQYDEAGYAR